MRGVSHIYAPSTLRRMHSVASSEVLGLHNSYSGTFLVGVNTTDIRNVSSDPLFPLRPSCHNCNALRCVNVRSPSTSRVVGLRFHSRDDILVCVDSSNAFRLLDVQKRRLAACHDGVEFPRVPSGKGAWGGEGHVRPLCGIAFNPQDPLHSMLLFNDRYLRKIIVISGRMIAMVRLVGAIISHLLWLSWMQPFEECCGLRYLCRWCTASTSAFTLLACMEKCV